MVTISPNGPSRRPSRGDADMISLEYSAFAAPFGDPHRWPEVSDRAPVQAKAAPAPMAVPTSEPLCRDAYERSRLKLVAITALALAQTRRPEAKSLRAVAALLEAYAAAVAELEPSLPLRLRGLAALMAGCSRQVRAARDPNEASCALSGAFHSFGQQFQMLN